LPAGGRLDYAGIMNSVGTVVIFTLIELSLIIIDFGLYYSQHGRIKVPFIIGCFLALVVLTLMVMAIYQSLKHRHDKEPW
jgi:hypothetical protein